MMAVATSAEILRCCQNSNPRHVFELVDLRKHHDIRRAFLAEGIDIDNSFVVEANGQRLLKNTAMSYLLVKLDYKRVARLFDSVILGPALYKALVFLRRTYLFIARIKPFKDAI